MNDREPHFPQPYSQAHAAEATAFLAPTDSRTGLWAYLAEVRVVLRGGFRAETRVVRGLFCAKNHHEARARASTLAAAKARELGHVVDLAVTRLGNPVFGNPVGGDPVDGLTGSLGAPGCGLHLQSVPFPGDRRGLVPPLGARMKSGAIDDLNTRQLRAYESFEAMDAWGLLRGSKEPCSAMQVAERLGLSLQVAQAALDVAEAAELVQKLPAGKGRRSITYQSVTDELVVELADGSTDEGRTAIDAWMMMGARHQEAILHRMVPVNRRAPKGDRFMTYATELRASKEDSDELLRRVVAVNRFVDEILDRMQDPAYASDGVYGPHAYFMRIAPIRGEIREAPLIKIHSSDARELVRGGRHDAPRTLTRREREIAVLLQRGLSRAEVAARLGVSVDTVSSHCKQLFKKLGVKRATELGRFSFESRDGAAQGGDANR